MDYMNSEKLCLTYTPGNPQSNIQNILYWKRLSYDGIHVFWFKKTKQKKTSIFDRLALNCVNGKKRQIHPHGLLREIAGSEKDPRKRNHI